MRSKDGTSEPQLLYLLCTLVQRVVGDGDRDPSWERSLLGGAQHQRAHCRSYTRMVLPRDGGLSSSPPSPPALPQAPRRWNCAVASTLCLPKALGDASPFPGQERGTPVLRELYSLPAPA